MSNNRFEKLRSPDGRFRVYDNLTDDILDANKVVVLLNEYYNANKDLENVKVLQK